MPYDIVGDTEIVGDAIDDVLRGTSSSEIIGATRTARVVHRGPTKLQRLPLGIGVTSIATGNAATITVTPQQPFKLERFISQSINLQVTDIKVGTNSQFVGSGSVPIEIFGRDSIGVDLKGDTAVPGVDIALMVANASGATVTCTGAYLGLVAS
jgi:hypothetical protein